MSTIIVRLATPRDHEELEHLAELDSAPTPSGATLIAELDDRPVAALSVADGAAIADPFVPTTEVVDLLRLRAEQLRPRLAPHGSARRLRSMRRRQVRPRRPPWH